MSRSAKTAHRIGLVHDTVLVLLLVVVVVVVVVLGDYSLATLTTYSNPTAALPAPDCAAVICILVLLFSVGRLKMRDMKMRRHVAGVENAGKVSMESQSVKKCLKVVVFVCRVIPSV